MPVTSPRPSVRSPRRLLAGSAFAALLLAQLGAPAGAGAAWTATPATTVTAAPAAPGAALEATADLQPTIQWEEAHAHEHDRITFKAGGRVTVPFRPRATDRWTVGGVTARALPAGRIDGAAMRRGDAPATHAVDQPLVDPSAVIDARAALASAPSTSQGGVREPQARVDPGALRREVFGFLPYWKSTAARSGSSTSKISTIAYFGMGATAPATSRSAPRTVRRRRWSGWTSASDDLDHQPAHATRTRVVLTVQSFALERLGADAPAGAAWQLDRARPACQADRRGGARSGRRWRNLDFEPLVSGHGGEFMALIKQIRTRLERDLPRVPVHVRHHRLGSVTTRSRADRARAPTRCSSWATTTAPRLQPRSAPSPRSAGAYDIRDTIAAYIEPRVAVEGDPWRAVLRARLVDGQRPRPRTQHQRDQVRRVGIGHVRERAAVLRRPRQALRHDRGCRLDGLPAPELHRRRMAA